MILTPTECPPAVTREASAESPNFPKGLGGTYGRLDSLRISHTNHLFWKSSRSHRSAPRAQNARHSSNSGFEKSSIGASWRLSIASALPDSAVAGSFTRAAWRVSGYATRRAVQAQGGYTYFQARSRRAEAYTNLFAIIQTCDSSYAEFQRYLNILPEPGGPLSIKKQQWTPAAETAFTDSAGVPKSASSMTMVRTPTAVASAPAGRPGPVGRC